jgi:DNA processing protein
VEGWGKRVGWREKQIVAVSKIFSEWELGRWQKYLQERKIRICVRSDDNYPPLLKFITDWPVVLFYQGDLGVLGRPTLAVVGARRVSEYGKRALLKVVDGEVAGLTIVSGMMWGVDELAHRRALVLGAKTAAFLGYGLEVTWPKYLVGLRSKIVQEGGVLVSEFAPWSTPRPQNFPIRNRLVAGSAVAVLVVEAAEKSGSLITANLAVNYGREVMVVPGSVLTEQTKGSYNLLRQGALPVACGEEVREAVKACRVGEWLGEKEVKREWADPVQNKICQLLEEGGLMVEELGKKLGGDLAKLLEAVSLLELAGEIRRNAEGRWERV